MEKRVISNENFHRAHSLLHEEFYKYKRFKNRRNLSAEEIKILEIYECIRNKDNQLAKIKASQLQVQSFYLKSHLHLVQGIASNNCGDYCEAISLLSKCQSYFQRNEDKFFLFLVFYNLMICYGNTGDFEKIKEYYFRLCEFKFEDKKHITKRLRALLLYEINANLLEEALANLNELRKNEEILSTADKANFYVDMFNLGIKIDNPKLIEEALDKIKALSKYSLNDNFRFMNSLYAFWKADKAIYLRKQDLSENEYLRNQALCIKSLSQSNFDKALTYWNKLRDKNPRIYDDNFVYIGDECLFSKCLDKCLSNKIEKVLLPYDLSTKNKLIYFSAMYSGVILKRDLFEAIFERPVFDKKDLSYLSKLISRYKNLLYKTVSSVHESYYFQDSDS